MLDRRKIFLFLQIKLCGSNDESKVTELMFTTHSEKTPGDLEYHHPENIDLQYHNELKSCSEKRA